MNIYARQGWEDRAAKLGTGFSIEKVAATYDEDVMRRARELHDVLFGAAPAWKSSAVAGTSTAEVGCAKAPLHVCVGGRVLSKAEAPRVPKRAAAAEHPDASASKFAKVKCFNCKASVSWLSIASQGCVASLRGAQEKGHIAAKCPLPAKGGGKGKSSKGKK